MTLYNSLYNIQNSHQVSTRNLIAPTHLRKSTPATERINRSEQAD